MATNKVLPPLLLAAQMTECAEECKNAKTTNEAKKAALTICHSSNFSWSCANTHIVSIGRSIFNAISYSNYDNFILYQIINHAMRLYASSKASDKFLTDFAENIVQILIEMETPGSKWL